MNSLKTFMNKVGERVREVAPQGPTIIDGTDPRNEEMEGFVCPTCFVNMPSPELLEKHYSEQHLDPSANYLCPVCKARLTSQSDLEMHYTSNHGDRDFTNHSIEALKEELMELSTNLREEKWYSEELRKEVERFQEAFKKKGNEEDDGAYVHKSQLDAVEESKKLLSSEVVLLRKQLAEALEQMSSLRGEKDGLEHRASDFAVEKADLRASLDSLQAEKVVLETDIQELRNNLISLENSKQEEIEKLKLEFSKYENAIESKTKEVQSLKETERALQQDLKLKSESLATLKEDLRNLKFEIDLMKKKLQEKSEESVSFQAKLKENEQLISTLKMNSNNFTENQESTSNSQNEEFIDEKTESEDNSLHEKEKEIDSLKKALQESESSKQHAEELLKEKMKVVDDLEDKISSITNTVNKKNDKIQVLETTLNEELLNTQKIQDNKEELEHYLNITRKEVDCANENITKLTLENDHFEKDILKHLARINELEEQNKIRDDELVIVQKRTEELDKCLASSNSQLAEMLETLNKKDETITEIENTYKKVVQEKEVFCQKLKLAEEEIHEHKQAISVLQLGKSTLEKEAETLSQRILSLENQIKLEGEQKTKMKNQITQLEKDLTKLKQSHNEELSQLHENNTQLEQERNTLIGEVNSLKFNIGNLSDEKQNIATENSHLKERINDFNADLQEKQERENKLNETIRELKNTIPEYEAKIKEYQSKISSLKTQISSLEENGRNDQSRISEIEGRLAAQEAEMAGLAGDKLELEVKVEASVEEQKNILERCVKAETEVERIQTQLTQLRRKLDDSTAALHELGRENQSLQMETAKLSGRKWAEDSEVMKCMKCQKTFSMTVRRHHCRNCYQIFCNDCSSKQASLEQNKKPVRVCEACYSEIVAKF